LREIHRLRRYAKALQERMEQGPRQLKIQQGRVAKAEANAQEGHDAVKRLKVAIHEKEVTLKSTQQLVKKHEKQRDEAGAKKEYDTLQAELAAERQRIKQLEDEILDTMMQLEEQTAKVPELDEGIKRAKAELARFESEMGARQAELTEQHKQALAQIAQTEATLPDNNDRVSYNRLIKAHGEDAMSPVQNMICLACHTGITSQQGQDLHLGNFVVCKACGRILYLPESS
jgi:predicted  nucleic acid-binding Zn-ribbon protein